MTNTLHRYGSADSFKDDYIVFAIPARGINDEGAVEKEKRFLEIARKHNPVNMGDASHGARASAIARTKAEIAAMLPPDQSGHIGDASNELDAIVRRLFESWTIEFLPAQSELQVDLL